MRFKEQVAVITGAASGIGLAVAKRLIQSEARVVLLDINKEALEDEFGGFPQQAMIFGMDITQQAEVRKRVDAAAAAWGRIHPQLAQRVPRNKPKRPTRAVYAPSRKPMS